MLTCQSVTPSSSICVVLVAPRPGSAGGGEKKWPGRILELLGYQQAVLELDVPDWICIEAHKGLTGVEIFEGDEEIGGWKPPLLYGPFGPF